MEDRDVILKLKINPNSECGSGGKMCFSSVTSGSCHLVSAVRVIGLRQSDADPKVLCEDSHKPQELDPRRKEGARASGGNDHLNGRNLPAAQNLF